MDARPGGEKMRRDLLSIGEFSRMGRLTVKALRLYDEQGILKPGYTDPQSGYRYYSSAQLAEANLVRMLRSLELSLDDIREYLRESDPARRSELLEKHRVEVERRLERYRSIVASVERLAERKGETMERTMETKELEDQPVVGMRFTTSGAKIGEDIGRAFQAIFGFLGKAGVPPAGPPFGLYYDEEFKEESIDAEICVPVAGEVEGAGELVGHIVKGGKVASTMHTGPFDEVGPAWEDLMAWIGENGFKPAGPAREVYLVGPGQVESPAEYRTEIICPIEAVG